MEPTNHFTEAIANGTLLGADVPAAVQNILQSALPTAIPTSIPQAISAAAGALGITSPNQTPPIHDILTNAVSLSLNGFISIDLQAAIGGKVLPPSFHNRIQLTKAEHFPSQLQSGRSLRKMFLQHHPRQRPLRHR